MNLRHLRVTVLAWMHYALVRLVWILKPEPYPWIIKLKFLYFSLCFLILLSATFFLLLWFWYAFSCLIIEKMDDEQQRYKYGWVSNMLQCTWRELDSCNPQLENYRILQRDFFLGIIHLQLMKKHILLRSCAWSTSCSWTWCCHTC